VGRTRGDQRSRMARRADAHFMDEDLTGVVVDRSRLSLHTVAKEGQYRLLAKVLKQKGEFPVDINEIDGMVRPPPFGRLPFTGAPPRRVASPTDTFFTLTQCMELRVDNLALCQSIWSHQSCEPGLCPLES